MFQSTDRHSSGWMVRQDGTRKDRLQRRLLARVQTRLLRASTVDVRDFIVSNVTPLYGNNKFLAGPTARTKSSVGQASAVLQGRAEERSAGGRRKNAVHAASHGPGYIDGENEVIVGLQTDKPFKRAIFPGGLRMVEDGLKGCRLRGRPGGARSFTKYRRTHNEACSMPTRRRSAAGDPASSPVCRMPTAAAVSSAIIGASPLRRRSADRSQAAERAADRRQLATDEVIRSRGDGGANSCAQDLTRWRIYGFDIGQPADARRPCNGPIGYLGAIKEANGAAMSLGRIRLSLTSTSNAI